MISLDRHRRRAELAEVYPEVIDSRREVTHRGANIALICKLSAAALGGRSYGPTFDGPWLPNANGGAMSRRAMVIGGGIGGLAAAMGLRQAGFLVEVYERSPGYE